MSNQLISVDGGEVSLYAAPAPSNLLGVQTDAQAIRAWLQARAGRSAHTYDAYRRESTRLFAWLTERGLALRQVSVQVAQDYLEHLKAPPPHWIRPKTVERDSALLTTQLLAGPLSATSLKHTRTILVLLFGYLADSGYLSGNPFKLTARPVVVESNTQERFLDADAWAVVWNWVCSRRPTGKPRNDASFARDRWLMALLYHTGLRREEAAGGVMGDFVRRNGAWQLRVIGKRSKERHVTVNSALLDELVRYRSVLFFSPPCPALPQPGERIPLVGSVQISNQQLMTPRRLHGLVHNIMRAAAATCDDPHIADRLNAASTHWMRHTNATHRLAAGASLDTTQDELGHSDPKTTRIYSATALAQRQADAELLVGRLNTSGNL